MVEVVLKDGSKKQCPKGISISDVIRDISPGLFRRALAAQIDGRTVEHSYYINEDCRLNILTFDDEQGKKAFWHTSSHILAQAVKKLFPGARLAIGPAVDNGFYYDFDVEKPFSTEDLLVIEEEMKKIIK